MELYLASRKANRGAGGTAANVQLIHKLIVKLIVAYAAKAQKPT